MVNIGDEKTKKYALIGKGISYSMSKALHEKIFAHCGVNATYEIIDTSSIGDIISYLREELAGFNVTKPYKVDIMSYLDEIDESARYIGSVNTVINRAGRLIGYNTDFDGIIGTFERDDISANAKHCLIIGYGGVARTCVYALYRMGAKSISVTGRNIEKMQSFVDSIDYVEVGIDIDVNNDYDIVINATSVGTIDVNGDSMQTALTPIDASQIHDIEYYFDLIYSPRNTSLAREMANLGKKTADGLYMLVSQAVKADEYYLDMSIEKDVINGIFYELAGEIFRKRLDNANFCGVALVGFMGSGKSTIGERLSGITNIPLVDTDRVIENEVGSISAIFDTEGEIRFRQIEREVLSRYTDEAIILSTGGGIITLDECRDMLKKSHLLVVFLDASFDEIESRVAGSERPLFRDVAKARELYMSRREMYLDVADIVVNSDDAESAIDAILRF